MARDRFVCYCCGYKTLTKGPGEYDICPVCYWEDDGSGLIGCDQPSSVNQGLRLRHAQRNFVQFGACHPQFKDKVRPPHPDEPRDPAWRPWYETSE